MIHKSMIETIAKIKLRIGRGDSYTNLFYRPLAIATFLKIWNLDLGLIAAGTILFMAGLFLIGLADEKYFKVWQAENNYATEELNPYFKKLKRRKV